MKKIITGVCAALAIGAGCMSSAWADRDKDESGHGRGHHKHQKEYKEEFWDGDCKVKRKWERDGDFKEERKCEGQKHGHRKHGRDDDQGRAVVAAPVVVYPPWVMVEGGRRYYRQGYAPVPMPAPAPVVVAPVAAVPVAAPVPVPVPHVFQCKSDTVGKVLGGVGGAVVGHQMGNEDNRVVTTIGGAVIGALIGGEIGRRIDNHNQACIGRALELGADGTRVEWAGNGGAQYAVVPGTVVNRNGTYCRPYEAQVRTATGWQKTQGTACRRPDGSWAPQT